MICTIKTITRTVWTLNGYVRESFPDLGLSDDLARLSNGLTVDVRRSCQHLLHDQAARYMPLRDDKMLYTVE